MDFGAGLKASKLSTHKNKKTLAFSPSLCYNPNLVGRPLDRCSHPACQGGRTAECRLLIPDLRCEATHLHYRPKPRDLKTEGVANEAVERLHELRFCKPPGHMTGRRSRCSALPPKITPEIAFARSFLYACFPTNLLWRQVRVCVPNPGIIYACRLSPSSVPDLYQNRR
jgi:hypothetical protein